MPGESPGNCRSKTKRRRVVREELHALEKWDEYFRQEGEPAAAWVAELGGIQPWKEEMELQKTLRDAIRQVPLRAAAATAGMSFLGSQIRYLNALKFTAIGITLGFIAAFSVTSVRVFQKISLAEMDPSQLLEEPCQCPPEMRREMASDSIENTDSIYVPPCCRELLNESKDTTWQATRNDANFDDEASNPGIPSQSGWKIVPGIRQKFTLDGLENCYLVIPSQVTFRDKAGNAYEKEVTLICTQEGYCREITGNIPNPGAAYGDNPLYSMKFESENGLPVYPSGNVVLESGALPMALAGSTYKEASRSQNPVLPNRIPEGYRFTGRAKSLDTYVFEIYENPQTGDLKARQLLSKGGNGQDSSIAYSILLTPYGPFWDVKAYPEDVSLRNPVQSIGMGNNKSEWQIPASTNYFFLCIKPYEFEGEAEKTAPK